MSTLNVENIPRLTSVDPDLPVAQMPPWANPGYLDARLTATATYGYSKALHCNTCMVRWRESDGSQCWNCGAVSTDTYWVEPGNASALATGE